MRAFASRNRLTSPWIICRLDGVSLHSIGSASKNKRIWLKLIELWLIKYRNIVLCQQFEQWNYSAIRRITSKEIKKLRFFTSDPESFLFYCYSINVPVSHYGQIFSGVRYFGRPAISVTAASISWLALIASRNFHKHDEIRLSHDFISAFLITAHSIFPIQPLNEHLFQSSVLKSNLSWSSCFPRSLRLTPMTSRITDLHITRSISLRFWICFIIHTPNFLREFLLTPFIVLTYFESYSSQRFPTLTNVYITSCFVVIKCISFPLNSPSKESREIERLGILFRTNSNPYFQSFGRDVLNNPEIEWNCRNWSLPRNASEKVTFQDLVTTYWTVIAQSVWDWSIRNNICHR